ncbi:DNA-binding transcriptional regulator, MarR family [Selenomonas sp. WCT3]|uniref:MarR family winged helix-turn-helix transcriptional regulator n=1 Tax=unclassified Selenomonas TaxID=2637378 RepID=UPI0008872028|nr:MarR family transcriptional regulator [Selenomonas sp.]MCR5439359.1 MarR family transcriptional regulator [Selenomonas sp.]SDG75768.1 DNA-binding transcriptional regulator, MarR family [Selenomonas ruminantium]
MKREIVPTWEELERHKRIIPEINPAAVIAMLGIKTVGDEIQQSILDVLQKEHNLSEGKFCALVVLHQYSDTGIAPSELAEKVGVTRATISNMLQRLERDGMVVIRPAADDGRGKLVILTEEGTAFMEKILPPHYLRVTKLMEKLSESEQKELIHLLKKLAL